MDQPEDARSLATVIVHTSAVALMGIFSLTGNSLVCLAFYRNRRLRAITKFYVLSLAVADIMMVTFCFPFHAIAPGLRRWPFNNRNFYRFTALVVEYIFGFKCHFVFWLWCRLIGFFCVVRQQKYLTFLQERKRLCLFLSYGCLQTFANTFFHTRQLSTCGIHQACTALQPFRSASREKNF